MRYLALLTDISVSVQKKPDLTNNHILAYQIELTVTLFTLSFLKKEA